VGAGPGDAGLITVKGLECLKKADTVIYDRLVSERLLRYIPQDARRIYAGKSPRQHTLAQDEINSLLVKEARKGRTVVRLKCGDPFVFGRGAEEAIFLSKHKIPFEVVPGVTSAIAIPAYAGIPLTHRAYTSSVGIFSGHEDAARENSQIRWEKIATGLGTLVFLMGVENLSAIVNKLIDCGRDSASPCCIIQQGADCRQKSVCADLRTIVKKAKENNVKPPAVLVIGEVIFLREKLNWFENKPLFGKRIFISQPSETESRLSKILEGCGAVCIEAPVIELRPLKDYTALDFHIKNIDDFQWVVLSSQNVVKFFMKRLEYLKKDARALGRVKIAAIGRGTAQALARFGLKADLMPKQFCQEGLVVSFKKINIKGKNIFLICAKEARNILAQGLKKLGARVTIAPAYITHKAPQAIRARQYAFEADIVTFTSAQGVNNFFRVFSKDAFKRLKKRPLIASIGPITSQEVRSKGLEPAIEAKEYTFEGLAQAIVKYYE
jgi:uroporphyrinogen III methyltransferase/synthase